jgi:hypothetical protein
MTVCVAVTVEDGVVFSADSATSALVEESGKSVIANVYRHGNKVFNLCRGLPIAAMTAGMGSIGRAPIHALAKDLRVLLVDDQAYKIDPETYSIEEIAVKARKFIFEDRYAKLDPKPAPPHLFEFWIGGFSAKAEQPEVWKVTILNGKCDPPTCLRRPGQCGVNWGGQPDPIHRLLIGFAQSTGEALVSAGVDPQELPKLLALIQARTEAPLSSPVMPIQDAIELTEFLVDLTKKYFRFYPGADIVGGETDIAAVTRHEKFKWIKRKHYYAAHLNPPEHDHV